MGNEGANVFGLLNRCRIFWWSRPPDWVRIKRVLLAEAVLIYRAAKKKEYVFIDRDGTDDCPSLLGYQFVAAGVRWLARTDVIPAWRSYIEETLEARGGDRERREQAMSAAE
jgi:hypothetical protein